jgi:mevalonate kinase
MGKKEQLVKKLKELKKKYEKVAKPIIDEMNTVKEELKELMEDNESIKLDDEHELVKQKITTSRINTGAVKHYVKSHPEFKQKFFTVKEYYKLTERKIKDDEEAFEW